MCDYARSNSAIANSFSTSGHLEGTPSRQANNLFHQGDVQQRLWSIDQRICGHIWCVKSSPAPLPANSRPGNSKLANVLHIKELQKRLNSQCVSITCVATHPGSVKTVGSDGFLESIPYFGQLLKNYLGPLFFGPWRNGAMTVAFAAAGKDVVDEKEKYQGAYMIPIATVAQASSFAQDERLQSELYDTTEKFVKELYNM